MWITCFARFWTFLCMETLRESQNLQEFEWRFEAWKHGINMSYKVSTASKYWSTTRIMCCIRSYVLEAVEHRMNHIFLRGFESFETLKHSANHAFRETSNASKHRNTARITYFAGFWALRSSETQRRVQHKSGLDRPHQDHIGGLDRPYIRTL